MARATAERPAAPSAVAAAELAASAATLESAAGAIPFDVAGGSAKPLIQWRLAPRGGFAAKIYGLAPSDPSRAVAAATVVRRRLAAWSPSPDGAGRRLLALEFADGRTELVDQRDLRAKLVSLRRERWDALERIRPTAAAPGGMGATEASERAAEAREELAAKAEEAQAPTVAGAPAEPGNAMQECRDEQARIDASGPIDMGRYLPDGTFIGMRLLECDASRPYGQRHVYESTFADDNGAIHVSHMITSPLVFDLSGDGPATTDRTVLFDIDGEGKADAAQWINDLAPGTGLLVLGRGRAGASGLQLFGDKTDLDGDGKPDGYKNGFEALAALVAKAVREKVLAPAVLTERRLDGDALAALEKAYGLGMKLGGFHGKVVSLREAGVRELAFSAAAPERMEDFDALGNDIWLQPGATFTRADGSTGAYADVWFAWAGSGRRLAPSPFVAKR